MKKLMEIALGIVTSIGGFLEIGSIVTAMQAGATFGFRLLWTIALGAICLIFLVEMSGRFSAVSRHTITDAIRERFGFNMFLVPLIGLLIVMLLVLAAEVGGVAVALELATGIDLRWWAFPSALLLWLLLWKGNFEVIEKGVSLLGLVTLVFVVAALRLHPAGSEVAAGLVPSAPPSEGAHYWFTAVSILGASISPYLYLFYSSGAIEDTWDESYLGTNRAVATIGMSFGGTLSAAALIAAAMVLMPHGVRIEHFSQMLPALVEPLGHWGFILFTASLGISCLGAALELALQIAYTLAQGFGWNWGENVKPRQAARFSLAYTVAAVAAAMIVITGIDPLQLTVISMALTAATLPLSIFPFIVLMNDERYVGEHRNGWIGNSVVIAVIGLACILAVVTIPLEIFGG
jgi:Mn2+/Fe2+ NRAMP family transporter